MSLPDNRLRFPAPAIDFDGDVGATGQAHDDWPAPGQARYDWMRMWLISLLASQSSYDEPTQYREGSLWFDLNTNRLMVRCPTSGASSTWVSLADVIEVGDDDLTLNDYVAAVQDSIATLAPEMTWSGHCNTAGATVIPVPATLVDLVDDGNTRATVYVNGLLLDPRTTPWYSGPAVRLVGTSLSVGDTFTVIIKNISGDRFHVPEVVV
jgi:hypothetical protein